MYTIVGFKENKGKFDNGREWSNYSLFCLKDEDNVNGKNIQMVKVPTKLLQDTFPDSKTVVGSDVMFDVDIRSYNGVSKPVVTGINIIKQKGV